MIERSVLLRPYAAIKAIFGGARGLKGTVKNVSLVATKPYRFVKRSLCGCEALLYVTRAFIVVGYVCFDLCCSMLLLLFR